MQLFEHWWLPDGETHLREWMTTRGQRRDGRLTYQYHKYEAALKHCERRRVAIDVGAHVGLWSYWMAEDFAQLDAFEPHAVHAACWRRNVTQPHATLHAVALGSSPGSVSLTTGPNSSGDTRVSGEGPVPMRTLDSWRYTMIDLLKIDCEGYEVYVLEGALETIRRTRPTIIVEQKLQNAAPYELTGYEAVALLEREGASVAWEGSRDFVLVWA